MTYIQPDAATLKLRFPAFAAVADETVEYWLTDARLTVTDSWIEQDRAPAEMALAAHNMATEGFGSAGGAIAGLADMGVTEFKSGALSAQFDASTVAARNAGGYRSTRYGVAFLAFLNRNVGGPFLAGCA
ncbi:DUF4054 domain-containing protein [Sphingomonas sp.]|uniref:DUF4054 domain-containing protein n=1 Tax=Sphingomonas sp. TaxID=28214 RepID=UPI002FDA60A4